ncbi:MAG TPA: hypothetical protein VGM92_06100 [Candidatus Kapabacteria bacterium]|jgi:hypothetical protein
MRIFCRIVLLIALAMFAILSTRAVAQGVPSSYILPVEATVAASPASITLHWPADAQAQHFYVFKRVLESGDGWSSIDTLPASAIQYVDNNVTVGTQYEYRVIDSTKNDSVYAVFGFLASGIEVPSLVQPGIVELIVDKTYDVPLKKEIGQLMADLTSEGWQVVRHDVARTDNVTDIQSTIENDYNNLYNVRTVFLLGHVPVPYSGDIAPDGHTPGNGDHQGAWPADVYYGNWDASWSDNTVDDTTAGDPRNRNIPGDGKFDLDAIDEPMDLEVGRVDLYNMPSSLQSDTLLLKQYLDRDHAFRTGQFIVPTRALIDDHFGCIAEAGKFITTKNGKRDTIPYVLPLDYDAPATDGWRNFPPLVGSSNIVNFRSIDTAFTNAGDWFGYLDTAKYLWAYGCGGGSYGSCGGVVSSPGQFASPGYSAVFTMMFGSFFGDWDHPDDILRGPLCSSTGLTCCWAGRPYWYFHPLGIGETFGYCARLSQDVTGVIDWGTIGVNFISYSDYMVSPSVGGVHVALMGDPTLRMQYLSDPPTSLLASAQNGSVMLTWKAPQVKVPGYNIYRADATGDTLLRINTSPVSGTAFTDIAPLLDSNIYVVRAAELTTTPSGSWWNESGGPSVGVNVAASSVAESVPTAPQLLVQQNGAFIDVRVTEATETAMHLTLVDMAGRTVLSIADGTIASGVYHYHLSTTSLAAGAYFIRLASIGDLLTAKVAIVR